MKNEKTGIHQQSGMGSKICWPWLLHTFTSTLLYWDLGVLDTKAIVRGTTVACREAIRNSTAPPPSRQASTTTNPSGATLAAKFRPDNIEKPRQFG